MKMKALNRSTQKNKFPSVPIYPPQIPQERDRGRTLQEVNINIHFLYSLPKHRFQTQRNFAFSFYISPTLSGALFRENSLLQREDSNRWTWPRRKRRNTDKQTVEYSTITASLILELYHALHVRSTYKTVLRIH